MLQILYLIWLWLVTPTRQESLTSLANSTVLSHAETRKSLFSQTGKGISGQWPLPSPGCSIKGYPEENRIWLLLSCRTWKGSQDAVANCASEHGALLRDNRVSPSTSGGPKGSRSLHFPITCGTSNLVFESCENLHVALSQNVEKTHVSGCRNPVTLCSILSSLSPSLSRTFRDAGFFFRGVHVSEIHFRELSRKTRDNNSPFSAVKCVLKPLIPSTTDIVLQQLSLWQHLDRYCIWWPPPPSPPRPPCDRGSQWAQPDTTSARSQWALPLPNQIGRGHPS